MRPRAAGVMWSTSQVRHEALFDRVEVKGLSPWGCRSSLVKLGAA